MTPGEIQSILKNLHLTPVKSKGQNFLISEEVVERIVEVSGVNSSSRVCEVGPGFGVLTDRLREVVGSLLLVELDDDLYGYLKKQYGSDPAVQLHHGDILKIKNEEIAKKLGGEYEVVANIPYSITSKIIEKFTSFEPKPARATLMMQKEVAERITAEPGRMSILGVATQFYAKTNLEFVVQRHHFWPAPEVDSAVVTLEPHSRYLDRLQADEKEFFRIVKIGFSARRKKLANNLAAGLRIEPDEAREMLKKAEIETEVRAQDLSVENWLSLAQIVFGK